MYKSILFIVCLLLFPAFSIFAQDDSYLKTYQERVGKNPKDVDFTIKFKNDQSKFRQGEIIPLELRFKTSTENRYRFLNRTYDRSGRLDLDGMIVDKKERTFDPLYDYFYRNGMLAGGGLYSDPTLGSGAELVEYELNEFLSFKTTGKYRIYIASPRVSIRAEKRNASRSFGGGSVPLVSNVIEFEILPADEKWQAEKFAEAVGRDCKILRYLGTKAAAKEMLTRYNRGDESCKFDNYIGLYGSPERKFIVDEMEKLLAAPDFAVSVEFFQMLLRLDYFLKNPEPRKTEADFIGIADKKEEAKQNLIKLDYLEKLSAALPDKSEKNFQKSLETYFSFYAQGEKQPPAELTNALIKNFADLPTRTQWMILQNSLNKLQTPAMLPVFQAIYDKLERINLDSYDYTYDREILNQSIKGIYNLDKITGKQIILNEMRRPKQKVYTSVLELLPKNDSPEPENILLEKLIAGNIPADDLQSVFMLIDHYEMPKLMSKLREIYADKTEKLECGAQLQLLKVFLKSDIGFGAEILDKAVKNDAGESCVGANLPNVTEPYWSPEIERIGLRILENEQPFIVGNAAKLLGKYGSIETKDKLWKRFERFNQEELSKKDSAEKKDDPDNWQIYSAQANLAVALSESPNWFFDQESNQRAANLCLYNHCKEITENLTKIFNSPAKIEAFLDDENQISFSVNQYKKLSLGALRKKLEQFPPDTTFVWISNAENPNDAKDFQAIREFVEAHRMKLKVNN